MTPATSCHCFQESHDVSEHLPVTFVPHFREKKVAYCLAIVIWLSHKIPWSLCSPTILSWKGRKSSPFQTVPGTYFFFLSLFSGGGDGMRALHIQPVSQPGTFCCRTPSTLYESVSWLPLGIPCWLAHIPPTILQPSLCAKRTDSCFYILLRASSGDLEPASHTCSKNCTHWAIAISPALGRNYFQVRTMVRSEPGRASSS